VRVKACPLPVQDMADLLALLRDCSTSDNADKMHSQVEIPGACSQSAYAFCRHGSIRAEGWRKGRGMGELR